MGIIEIIKAGCAFYGAIKLCEKGCDKLSQNKTARKVGSKIGDAIIATGDITENIVVKGYNKIKSAVISEDDED